MISEIKRRKNMSKSLNNLNIPAQGGGANSVDIPTPNIVASPGQFLKAYQGELKWANPAVNAVNGSINGAKNIFAPESGGIAGQVLKSNGNEAPSWRNLPTAAEIEALPLSGGSLEGAVNFAPNTMNLVGEDSKFGSIGNSGEFVIQGNNGETALRLKAYNTNQSVLLSQRQDGGLEIDTSLYIKDGSGNAVRPYTSNYKPVIRSGWDVNYGNFTLSTTKTTYSITLNSQSSPVFLMVRATQGGSNAWERSFTFPWWYIGTVTNPVSPQSVVMPLFYSGSYHFPSCYIAHRTRSGNTYTTDVWLSEDMPSDSNLSIRVACVYEWFSISS